MNVGTRWTFFSAILALGGLALVYGLVNAKEGSEIPKESTTLGIGGKVADFELTDTEGKKHSLAAYLDGDTVVVLEWFNPQCPYVRKYHAGGNPSMKEAYAFAEKRGVVWLAINSNDPGKPGGDPELSSKAREEFGMEYPILLDGGGTVGQAFGTTSTPQIIIISEERKVIYNGGVDDTVLHTDEPSINYVIHALELHLEDKPVEPATTPHPGCAIKYAK
ncbi:redoxin family protein [bacterium]|nr:redoxin family protein [bacterium]